MNVYNELFTFQDTDEELLLPRIKVATESMTTKLRDDMKNQLPGGKYWNPSEEDKLRAQQRYL